MTSPDLNLKKYGDTSFITGLRAYAVIAVIMIHCGGAGLRDFGQIGNNIADWGRTGVYMFFVISGFAITASFYKEKSVQNFYIKRFLRIAPLYYAVILLAFFVWNQNIISLGLHFLFINWTVFDYANDMINVEWSIPVEIFFYALFPLLLKNAGFKRMVILTILAFGLYTLAYGAIQYSVSKELIPSDAQLRYHFSPFRYFFPFFLGSTCYFIREYFKDLTLSRREICYAFAGLIILFLWMTGSSHEMILMSVATAIFIIFGGNGNRISHFAMDNRPTLFLGKISYSLYLVHMPILYLFGDMVESGAIKFITVSLLSIAVSSVTYIIIESPSQNMAKKLIKSMR